MKTNFTLKEVARRNEVCLECEKNIVNAVNGFSFYCMEHKTDSIVFLVDKCKKLEELK